MGKSKAGLESQIKSLSPDDDERTHISKVISWILRRGASQAVVQQDADKWVKWSDLCAAEVLKEHSSQFLWQVVVDYNGKKMRYELNDAPGGPWIRSYGREERDAKSEAAKKQQQPQQEQQTEPGQDKGAVAQGTELASGDPQMYNPYMSMDPYSQQVQAAQAAAWMMQMQVMSQQYMQQAAATATANRFYGWVKSVNTEKGFGFITCPQTYAEYQRDVFVRSMDLEGLVPGQMVMFTCEKNKQDMPQARDVVVQGFGQQAVPMATGKGKGQGKDGKGKDGKGKDGKGKDGKGKDGKGKGKDGNKGKDGKKGNEGAGEAKRPTLEMPKTIIADLGALAPPKTIIADLGALAPPKTIIADLGALEPPRAIVADLGVQ